MQKVLNNIIITAEQICNSKDTAVLLVSVRKGIEYANGKPTGNIDHYKYDSALPYNQFEKIPVKIKINPGCKLVIPLTSPVKFVVIII